MMTMKKMWKLVITNKLPMPPLAFAFTVKSHITFPNFCTQIVSPSTTQNTGVVTEFLISKCGLSAEEITKTFRHYDKYLHLKSSQNLEEVLELLNRYGLTTPAQIRKVVLCNPMFLFRSAERNIKSKFTFLGTFMKEEHICKLLLANANIFNAREDKFISAVSLLQRLGIEGQALSQLVATQPRLLTSSEQNVMESFKQTEHLGLKKGSKMFAATLRAICGVRKETLERRLQCLSSLGFSENQISLISRRKPMILGLTEENLKCHVDFMVKTAGLTFGDLVKYPMMFQCSLEKRVIPRYRVIEALKSMSMLKTEICFPSILMLTEKRFLEMYVDLSAESLALRDIYHSVKSGRLSIDKETSSESDVGPMLDAVHHMSIDNEMQR